MPAQEGSEREDASAQKAWALGRAPRSHLGLAGSASDYSWSSDTNFNSKFRFSPSEVHFFLEPRP